MNPKCSNKDCKSNNNAWWVAPANKNIDECPDCVNKKFWEQLRKEAEKERVKILEVIRGK